MSAACRFAVPERLDPAVELSPKRLPAVVPRQVCWLHLGPYAAGPGHLVSAKHSGYGESALDPYPTSHPVSYTHLGLRGRESITTSGIVMLERYARKLQAGENKLILVGVEPRVRREFDRTGVTSLLGEENIFASSSSLGGPLQEALRVANEWVTRKTENVQND